LLLIKPSPFEVSENEEAISPPVGKRSRDPGVPPIDACSRAGSG
jgi:hypothetical protein